MRYYIQVGDWAASAIKRFVKVKDFGNIMPGHGGALTGLTVYYLPLLWYTFI
ncbi:phosphatidate cytidylyltransferase [Acetivibrio straminisolvens JCM 21531]|uniref:Phosphatidate cytidylyltransferase n=1 Tax=Acetivibrio straminisolvens JCM 21531 TaxID=1294263 RepID=W4V3V6_9FIRM|nr:phosphatidate cytidylyltransferase [Acetivibrio straminisolvens JCM 21531]